MAKVLQQTTWARSSSSDVDIDPSDMIFRFLDTVGDGTGTKEVTGNHAAAAEEYFIAPPTGEIYVLARMLVAIEDTTGMQVAEYGNLGSALSTGLLIDVQDSSGQILDLLDGVPIQTNGDWGRFCYDVFLSTFGAGNEQLHVRWTFERSGKPLYLDGTLGQKLVLTANDDFSGLISHTFMVQGYKVT